jgi:DNA polymerase-3 subunit alpha
MPLFSHLHVHTQYSLLDGAASISGLVKKAKADGMPSIAITDHGNMFGVFEFVSQAAQAGIKPIVGCEFYVVEDRFKKQFTKDDRDVRYHQLMLAKNEEGYKNLTKLCSYGFIDGLYSKYPRIDKDLVLKYHKGLIATTCCLGAEVPKTILRKGEGEAEKVFKWWLDLFGEDYYIELQRHDIPEQNKVNEVLLRFAEKYKVPIIASNDSHYIEQSDWNAHDILLCINTGEKKSTPTMKEFADDDASVKGRRFAFYNDQFYFKTTEEMSKLFADLPQAIDNTNEIVDKVETLNLKRDILLPNFPLPQEFNIHQGEGAGQLNQWEYLKHLTFEGAKKRYGELNAEIEERLNFELFTIKTMGFAGYFLIVADFIQEGRNMGVFVGPGRGSAAGSAVAYCIGITNIDPIKYDLLFERFLNPDRKSMPDIDTDFDDAGRQKVIDYVVKKYGKYQVAQIITFGTMAAKMSIKDVARVLELPIEEANNLAKMVPERPGVNLDRLIHAPLDGENSLQEKENLNMDDLEQVKNLRKIHLGLDLRGTVIKEALRITGSIRNTGVHAAGIIIAPTDLTDLLPIAVSKESELFLTQFDGKLVESAGVIKMDFLGLKNLSIIKEALLLIEQNHDVKLDIDQIPLDDVSTLELFQRGETNGIFQFESDGMQKYLKELRPDKFEDLIAMNALYRPGPMSYIPNYVGRKHGREAISYDLPDMEEILRDTYGITVYQEQVMLLSQKLAGFSKGDADVLRKAMGKKDRKTLDKLKPRFIEEAGAKGHSTTVLEKIWTDWEAFASYAFNKSHSTCYAFVAFQTAYLKAHFPGEYMSAVLSHNQGTIESITFFMDECRRMGIRLLGPDINESGQSFTVNKQGDIRFGLGAIKGAGETAVQAIIEERQAHGSFTDIFNFVERVNLRAVNKKTFESLVFAGAFDAFTELHRALYFHKEEGEYETNLEKIIRYTQNKKDQQAAGQHSLFSGTVQGENTQQSLGIKLSPCEPWSDLEKLKKEKEVIGFYLSGHPLDQYRRELQTLCNSSLEQLKSWPVGKAVTIAGIVSSSTERVSKKGHPYGQFVLEDFNSSTQMMVFGENYLRNSPLISNGKLLLISGIMEPDKGFGDNPTQGVRFTPQQFSLLGEVADKQIKSVRMMLSLSELSNKATEEIIKLAEKNPGNCLLRLTIKGRLEEKEVSLDLSSRKIRVSSDKLFLDQLEKLAGSPILLER